MNNDKDLFRQALQRQNERAATMKMPDDMEQRVMHRIRSKKVNRRWLYTIIATVAASILLILVFRFSQEPVEEQSFVAETIEKSIPQPVPLPVIEEKNEEVLAEVQPMTKPVKKQRKAVGKQSAEAEPVPTAAEPAEEILPAEVLEAYAIAVEPMPEAYADIEAEMRDIRSRGERVEAMVAGLTRSF